MTKEAYIFIPIKILTYQITPQAKLLYGLLYKETNKGQKGYKKTYTHLAIQLDCTTRTIYNAIKELKENNLINISKSKIEEKKININTDLNIKVNSIQQFYTLIR